VLIAGCAFAARGASTLRDVPLMSSELTFNSSVPELMYASDNFATLTLFRLSCVLAALKSKTDVDLVGFVWDVTHGACILPLPPCVVYMVGHMRYDARPSVRPSAIPWGSAPWVCQHAEAPGALSLSFPLPRNMLCILADGRRLFALSRHLARCGS
jgi:hypothetical protein